MKIRKRQVIKGIRFQSKLENYLSYFATGYLHSGCKSKIMNSISCEYEYRNYLSLKVRQWLLNETYD